MVFLPVEALALLCGACPSGRLARVTRTRPALDCKLLSTGRRLLSSMRPRGLAHCQAHLMFLELVSEGILPLLSYGCGPLSLSVKAKDVNYSAQSYF